MIRNAGELAEGHLLECDICIAGAGAAGITMARELSGSKLRIIVLESGGLDFDEEVQALYQTQVNSDVYNDPETSRLRYFGGSTNHWAGSCGPLDAIDFEVREWLPYSGWPFTRADLDPYYEKARNYCELAPISHDVSYWEKIRGHPELPFDPKIAITGLGYLSTPTRFGKVYRNDLGRSENVQVYLNANLLDINLHDDGAKAETLLAGGLDGKRFAVKARIYVLALGGIENARMLLNCDKVHSSGIGNHYDLLGRYLMDHPVVSAVTIFFSDPKIDLEFYRGGPPISGAAENARMPFGYLKLSDAAIKQHGLNNVRAPLLPMSRYMASEGIESLHQFSNAISAGRLPDNLGTHAVNVVRDFDMIIEGISRKAFNTRLFESANDLDFMYSDVMIEQRPEASNRITLSQERDRLGLRKAIIDWRLADADKENLWRAMELIAKEFGRAGLGRVRIEGEHEGRTFGELLGLGDHHMGTTRAHENPKNGVVDGNLKVHGVANLFVAGSSVFPTGGHVPPTLTIVALALRLAAHLQQKIENV